MAKSKKESDSIYTSLDIAVSSEELLQEAYSTMGRTRKGDRIESRQASASGALTSSANASSTASSATRAMAAEEIAKLLKAESAARSASQSADARAVPTVKADRPRAAPPRPRRTTHTDIPPLTTEPPPPAPPQRKESPRPPVAAPAPQPPPAEGAPRSRRNIGWLIFAGIWVISALIGSITDNSDSNGDTTPEVPDVTVGSTALTSTTLDLNVPPEAVTNVNIRAVDTGSCIAALPLGDTIDTVPTVDCSIAHEYEVFANVELTDLPDSFPGFDTVLDRAFEICTANFESYVGEAYASSQWFIDVVTPTESGWNDLGDRQVNCLLYIWDEAAAEVVSVTGSAAGSGA